MGLEQALQKVVMLNERVNEVGKGYFHTNPLSSINSVLDGKLEYSLFDWGIIGAITQSPLLLTGDTDRGKTDFAKIIMTALLGEEEKFWHKTNIDLDFGSLTYSGTDFGAIQKGKRSDDLFYEKDFLSFPGLIWDEPNRAAPKLLNKLLHILEKDFHLENGKKVLSGSTYYKLKDGSENRYQYHILAMNEGSEFHGTFSVDRALRRRQTIEIPIDIFQTTMYDKKRIGEERKGALEITNGESHLKEVISIMNSLDSIPISEEAEHYLLYLQSMSYCNHSLSKNKKGINFGEQICSKPQSENEDENPTLPKGACHYLGTYRNRMCPNVFGLTDGVSINMTGIAKAHALLRALKTIEQVAVFLEEEKQKTGFFDFKKAAAKRKISTHIFEKMATYLNVQNTGQKIVPQFIEAYVQRLKVEPIDFYAVLPFVAYSKMELNPHWVEKNYQGSRWYAIKDVANVSYEKVTELHENNPELFKAVISGKSLDESQSKKITALYKQDLWLKQSLAAYDKKNEVNPPLPAKTVLDLLR